MPTVGPDTLKSLPELPGRQTKSAVLAAGEYANFNAKYPAISNRRLAFQEKGSLQEGSTRTVRLGFGQTLSRRNTSPKSLDSGVHQ